jgi:hypothetical protein
VSPSFAHAGAARGPSPSVIQALGATAKIPLFRSETLSTPVKGSAMTLNAEPAQTAAKVEPMSRSDALAAAAEAFKTSLGQVDVPGDTD